MTDKFFYKQTTIPELFAKEEEKPPAIPDKIGPYKIESLLNKGGMSLLYLGLDPDTKRPLAIKVLSPQYVNHPEMIQRFLKESEIIRLANHPNIVKLFGQGEWEGGLYIAMELIQGVSLQQFILQQSLSLKRSIDIILQVAYALCHLHTHGVIHRDLKPENILITEDGEIKVIDFGIAQLHEDFAPSSPEQKNQFQGTPNYMSPEQKENPFKASFSSDIYALGIIAYELILGKLSFGLINLSLLPKGLRKIIAKTLAVSAKERYQDIVDFITDLTQYLKSGEAERERPGSDQYKEVMELLQQSQQLLSPLSPPFWRPFEIGVAKFKSPGQPGQMGLYYDFFAFANNTYGILIAEAQSPSVDSSIYTAVLRGMVKMFIRDKMEQSKELFFPVDLITTLNKMLTGDSLEQPFALSFLLLNPFKDQLSYVSCGLGSLYHLPAGSKQPRKLVSSNSLLGTDPLAEFMETVDNWNMGDTLVFHSLETDAENMLPQAITENASLSAQRQAEAILKKISSSPALAQSRHPKVIITLQRIS